MAGGRRGINRAIGNGAMSVDMDMLKSTRADAKHVRVVVVSDTHGEEVVIPDGDVIVHCGDMTLAGTPKELYAFCDWFEALPHKHKVVIAGNHDFCVENKQGKAEAVEAKERLKKVCTAFLENSGAEVAGLKFYGSPHSPWINKRRQMGYQDSSENLEKVWRQIPEGIDVLVTHTPPKGFGDRILLGMSVGCPNLEKRVREIKPRYHFFGHIHEAYGTYTSDFGCLFVNAAICNLLYEPAHAPIVLDIPLLNHAQDVNVIGRASL